MKIIERAFPCDTCSGAGCCFPVLGTSNSVLLVRPICCICIVHSQFRYFSASVDLGLQPANPFAQTCNLTSSVRLQFMFLLFEWFRWNRSPVFLFLIPIAASPRVFICSSSR